MRYFTLIDFQHWVLALFFGLLAVILIYVAWRLSPEERDGRDVGSIPAGNVPRSNPIPPILIFIAIYALLGALGYAILEGMLDGPIG